ncbi:DUF1538 family protein [Magnetospirillum sulfuroxidans]|uniref:DUF1538 domain-containing protein n=1 Tax=Magnetospirillum sulfuroxidans TaxID=611300 RepID=A0ABS5IEN2_9PROT|nr:DUF1538 domain-containing protein [Magnetospirillum sulfuroxidans]
MAEEIRIKYSDYRRETRVRKRSLSFSKLTRLAAKRRAEAGAPRWRRVHLNAPQVVNILSPYIGGKVGEQFRAIAPLAVYLAVFQLLVLHQHIEQPWSVFGGLIATLVGLMLFMEGLRLGLMPFGETIGHYLPRHHGLTAVLVVALMLGMGVTFAEPAIGALRAAGALVQPQRAPYLYAMLNGWAHWLVLAVAIGVGLAAIIGMLMFLRSWSLKIPVTLCTLGALGLTVLMVDDPALAPLVGLAWDCGGVTTGPVTVPLVLALGIGVAGSAGKGESSLVGFGIVTLASLLPVLAVLALGLLLAALVTPDQAMALGRAAAETSWTSKTPAAEIISALRAILPLVVFLALVARFARAAIADRPVLIFGIALALAGMALFNIGLSYGLAALGGQTGNVVPGAFAFLPGLNGSPMYDYGIGVAVAVLFAVVLGFGATIAEPALNAMGATVETLSNGAFGKRMLIWAVSAGVATGLGLGVLKLVLALPLWWFLLPGYGLALVMTWLSTETFVNVGWDSAGVTTGPVTVPLVLAMGLGFGGAVGAVDGFGLLALASLGPILSVLGLGLFIRLRHRLSAIPILLTDPQEAGS